MRTLSQRNSLLLRLNENKRGSVPPNVIGCDTKKQLAVFVKGSLVHLFSHFRSNQSSFSYGFIYFLRHVVILSSHRSYTTTSDFRYVLRNPLPILLLRCRTSTTCLQGRIAEEDMKNERKNKYVDCIVGSCNDAVARTCFVII